MPLKIIPHVTPERAFTFETRTSQTSAQWILAHCSALHPIGEEGSKNPTSGVGASSNGPSEPLSPKPASSNHGGRFVFDFWIREVQQELNNCIGGEFNGYSHGHVYPLENGFRPWIEDLCASSIGTTLVTRRHGTQSAHLSYILIAS